MNAQRQIYTVSQVNGYLKELLDRDGFLSGVFVRGEISNYKTYPSGHHYFSMKDEGGAIRCVMFRREAAHLRFRPENGMKVIAFGRVAVFPRDGQYQLYCAELSPDGVGDLHVAFEQCKEKLFREGLFDPGHKKPLPQYPERIALVTSPVGAAVRDMLRILKARWPMARVLLLPVRVQGVEAAREIAGAIRYASAHHLADVLITGRGGGSMEDLWCFNDELVARAIYDCDIPVISAVGHEPDVTIADFVADLRAARPDLALSTDLIVGFPGESEEEFADTLAAVDAAGFMSSFSFCYSDRPGTRASAMPFKVPREVQLERLERLQALQDRRAEAWLQSRVGLTTTVLLEAPSPRQDGEGALWQGRDPWGDAVHVRLQGEKGGRAGLLLPVRIETAKKHSLVAAPL